MSGAPSRKRPYRSPSDALFFTVLWGIALLYVGLIVVLLAADAQYTSWSDLRAAVNDPHIRSSIWLTFWSCWISAVLSVIVAVPTGYILSRYRFPLKGFFDAVLDIPIVLPPLVIGLSLLILFNQMPIPLVGHTLEYWIGFWLTKLFSESSNLPTGVTYKAPAIVLAQFTVACAFAVRTMRNTFDGIDPRQEQVALTLGCNRSRAFWEVALPQAGRGVLTAGTLAWARSLGEFGPVLVFAGATRGSTEVLATSVFLEISIGNLEGAVAVSFLMVSAAIVVLMLVRLLGAGKSSW